VPKAIEDGSVKDTQLYEQLLGLSKPWSVNRVEVELQGNRITVHVQCDKGVVWGDPETGCDRAQVHGWVRREWRHLDTCRFETRIVAEVPRLKYKSGRVEDAAVPWAERYSRITLMMEAFVVRLLQAAANISRVASLIKLDWHTVNGVIARAVERGLARRTQEPVRHLGLDEKSFARGHNYASVLTDVDRSRVLEVSLSDHARLVLRLAWYRWRNATASAQRLSGMDLSQPYLVPVSGDSPWARSRLCSARRTWSTASLRYLETWNLSCTMPALASMVVAALMYAGHMSMAMARTPARCSQLRLASTRSASSSLRPGVSFAAFWDYRYPKSAQAFFDAWTTRAMRSRIEPIKAVTKMLRRHRDGLMNYTKHRITNAAAEGFNSIIQTIKANARGFRSFDNFRTRILFFCGKLDLMPASVRSH
jgi:transposase